jgi:hypothetical protein
MAVRPQNKINHDVEFPSESRKAKRISAQSNS